MSDDTELDRLRKEVAFYREHWRASTECQRAWKSVFDFLLKTISGGGPPLPEDLAAKLDATEAALHNVYVKHGRLSEVRH